jgi:hypothetical protein
MVLGTNENLTFKKQLDFTNEHANPVNDSTELVEV